MSMGETQMRKMTVAILVFVLLFTGTVPPVHQKAQASSDYITVETFIKNLITEMNLAVDQNKSEPYISAAIDKGIVKEGDFSNYNDYITKTDAAVLLIRADEYLHGDTVKEELLKVVLDKRISDIEKVPKSKREAVGKCFAKGIIKGYSNGYYIQNRSFKGSENISTSTAKTLIKLVMNPEDRAKISPDGMLIRTTNLPRNADKYEYILACYPNRFYEKKFEHELIKDWKKYLDAGDDYIYPVNMRKSTFKNFYDEWPLSEEMDKYLYDWSALEEKYLNYVFNVDYRTVNDKWIEGLGALYAKSNLDYADCIRKYYIKQMKSNHVIVESSIIAVEPSTLYHFYSDYYMRAYVRYRITAKNINTDQYQMIYTQYPALDNLKNGEWRTGIFDIRFGTNNGSSGDGSDFAIDTMTHFIDAFNIPVE
jgi:hypothetical protein